VLDGDPIPQGKGAILGENVAAHCTAMGHSTVSCTKTAEPIEILFSTKTRVGQRNHVLDVGTDPPKESAIFGGCLGHSKALVIFAAAVHEASLSRSLQQGSFNRQ